MGKKNQTFEYYLRERHAEQYTGTGNMMPDDFNTWIKYLSADSWIGFAEAYHTQEIKRLKEELTWWHNLISKNHDNKKTPNLRSYVEHLQKVKEGLPSFEEIKTIIKNSPITSAGAEVDIATALSKRLEEVTNENT